MEIANDWEVKRPNVWLLHLQSEYGVRFFAPMILLRFNLAFHCSELHPDGKWGIDELCAQKAYQSGVFLVAGDLSGSRYISSLIRVIIRAIGNT